MQNASWPRRTSGHVVRQIREGATLTPAGSARTRPAPRSDPPQLEGGPEGVDLFGGLLRARFERLAVAVDPDHRHLELHARLDVVVVAGRDVDPALLAADAALPLLEV